MEELDLPMNTPVKYLILSSMEERMTACNMSIEGGARVGYVNPDAKTFDYLKGRPYSPQDEDWDKASHPSGLPLHLMRDVSMTIW